MSFWHGPTDNRRLSLYRAGFGALLCVESLTRLPYAPELFSSDGFHQGFWAASAPSPLVSYLLCFVLVLSAGAMALGLYTRIATAITLCVWGFLYAVDQVNEKALHTIVVVVMAMLLSSDSGARFSLDDRRRIARGLARSPETGCAMPLRLLQLQFAQIYFFAGVGKLFSNGWITGNVLSGSLSSRWSTSFGLWLAGQMTDWMARVGGLGVTLYEILAPFLLFVPWARPWVLVVGLSLHLGIQLTLGIGFLGWHFILALLVLYPSDETMEYVFKRITR